MVGTQKLARPASAPNLRLHQPRSAGQVSVRRQTVGENVEQKRQGAGERTPTVRIRPSSAPSRTRAPVHNATKSRPQSAGWCRRFSRDEAVCFKRVPTPSNACENRFAVVSVKSNLVDENWHMLPVNKGKFFDVGKDCRKQKKKASPRPPPEPQVAPLRDEGLTTKILDVIFPPSPAIQAPAPHSLTESRSAPDSHTRGSREVDTGKRETAQLRSNSGGVTPSLMMKGYRISIPSNDLKEVVVDVMNRFRKLLLEEFVSVQSAFAAFQTEFPLAEKLTLSEFRMFFNKLKEKYGWEFTRAEHKAVFERLDLDGSGDITLDEFHIALEAVAPVRSLEDLRRRWLASKYTSMLEPLNIMDHHGSISHQRLTLKEFGEALSDVQVKDASEHEAIFYLVVERRPGERDKNATVSVAELASAVACTSPSLLLEDVRRRIVKEYKDSLERAFWDLDKDHGGTVSKAEFELHSVKKWGFTHLEAAKIFREIDVDSSGQMTRMEFLAVMGLSEACLFLEDLRLKVRQRYKSIEHAFQEALSNELQSIFDAPKMNLVTFLDTLTPIGFGETEIAVLFNLMDTERDDNLTFYEFLRGMKHFAPACLFHSLQSRCLEKYSHKPIPAIFDQVDIPGFSRAKPLDFAMFSRVLDKVGLLEGVQAQTVYDILDIRCTHQVSIGQLITALQAAPLGLAVKPTIEALQKRAEMDVRSDMEPMRTFAQDLRRQVRLGSAWVAPLKSVPCQRQGAQTSIAAAFMAAGNHHEDIERFLGGVNAGTTGTISRSKTARTIGVISRSNTVCGTAGSPNVVQHRSESKSDPTLKVVGETIRGGTHEQNNHATFVTTVDKGNSASNSDGLRAPRLKTASIEDVAAIKRLLDPAWTHHDGKAETPKADTSRDVTHSVQHSWSRLWECVPHDCASSKPGEMRKDLQVYFQTAVWHVSHDIPLLQKTQSRRAPAAEPEEPGEDTEI